MPVFQQVYPATIQHFGHYLFNFEELLLGGVRALAPQMDGDGFGLNTIHLLFAERVQDRAFLSIVYFYSVVDHL